ncbi:MAG: ABC transporter permease [Chloroflexota bacterium]
MSDKKETTNSEIVMLKPSKGWTSLNLGDLWRYRELAFFLTWRDIKVRYKQTALGALWAIIQPLMQMIVFNFLFGSMGKIPTGDIPRPIFTFAALLPWNLFSKALSDASRSLVSNRNMITKVYFPRLLVPLSSILSGVVDFAIAFVILLGMMMYYGFPLTSAIWAMPLFLILALMAALGVGLWLSAWNLHYRDVRYMLPFVTQLWMFLTPIAYPLSEAADKLATILPGNLDKLYYLNPMVGVVEGFRWALLGTEQAPIEALIYAVAVSLVLLISGMFYFRRMERTFADMV